jgi:uncharacterized protein
MNFLEKLRQEEDLKKKNETRLNSSVERLQSLVGTELEWISSHAPTDPQELLRKAIAKRSKKQPETSRNVGESLPDWERSASILGGRSLSNEFGSYVYRLEQCIRSCHDLKASHQNLISKISGLVSLLRGGQTVSELGQVVFLDTETTGLSGGTGTYAFLIGIGSWDGSLFTVEQFFMRDFHEEPALLQALEERLKPARVLITFNGKSFDIPLLRSRFTLTQRAWPLTSVFHVDLLFPARRIWKLRLGDCRLGNLEKEILGDDRPEDVAGNLIPQIYFNYTRSGNPAGIRKILKHNFRDIVTLARLTMKVSEILHGKKKTALFPEELFSVGSYFNQLGEREAAMDWNQSALNFPLQRDLRLAAMKSLATSYRSRRLFSQAVELWNSLIEESASFHEEAYESLSVHYEHREKNLAKALELTEQALQQVSREASRVRWMCRRARLLRKIQKAQRMTQFAFSGLSR